MSAGERIEQGDILKGDQIRWIDQLAENGVLDVRYVAGGDGEYWSNLSGRHYLLSRPKPAVVLPERATLGWLHTSDGIAMLGHWRDYTSTYRNRDDSDQYRGALQDELDIARERVTAFTEAVAVPLEALDTLREKHDAGNEHPCGWVSDFFHAIDSRGGGEG